MPSALELVVEEQNDFPGAKVLEVGIVLADTISVGELLDDTMLDDLLEAGIKLTFRNLLWWLSFPEVALSSKMSYNDFVGSINNLEIAMTNSEMYDMFVNATNAYVQTLREIKEMDMIHSISLGGLIDQLHDEMYEVESELLDYDEGDEEELDD